MVDMECEIQRYAVAREIPSTDVIASDIGTRLITKEVAQRCR